MPSSVIKAWSYDADSRDLTVTFVGGRAYGYQGVPADIAQGLRLAFAKGEYFNKAIRDRYPAVPMLSGTKSEQRSLL